MRMGAILKKDHRFRETGFKIRGKYGLLKNCDDDTAPHSPEQTLLDAKVDFFGRSLCFLESPGVHQFATIGAVIKISEKYFALTAAHVFESNTDKPAPTDTRPETTFAGEILDDEFFDSFDDEGYDEPSSSPDDQDQTQNSSEPQSSRLVRFEPSSTSRIVFSQNEPVIASTAAICHPEDEHTDNTTTLIMDRSLDWAIIDLKNWSGYEPVNFLVKDGISLSTIDCVRHHPQGEVMVVSQACKYPIARCSGTQALLRMPGCDSFQSVFALESLPSAQLSIPGSTSGQSGALIIDSISGEAYGMLAAQCPSLNMQYIIPIRQIFEDISHHFRDECVMLPTGEPQMNFKTHIDAVETVLLNRPIRGTTPLHVAAAVGDPVVVKAQVRAGADMTARDDQGTVPLHLAAVNGHAEAVQAFIAAGAPEESRDGFGRTALILAAGQPLAGGSSDSASDRDRSYVRTVDVLLRNGANVNTQDTSSPTALFAASKAGQTQIVELLLQHGADVNTKTIYGKTSLHMASKAGHTQIVERLLQHGADVNTQTIYGKTSLYMASKAGHTQIVELLLQHGADVNMQTSVHKTALQAASKAGHMQIVELLLQHGADVNTHNTFDGTALYAASKAGQTKVVELLLQHGADVNTTSGFSNETALYAASKAGHKQIVELLVEHGADENAKSAESKAPRATSERLHAQLDQRLLQPVLDYSRIPKLSRLDYPDISVKSSTGLSFRATAQSVNDDSQELTNAKTESGISYLATEDLLSGYIEIDSDGLQQTGVKVASPLDSDIELD